MRPKRSSLIDFMATEMLLPAISVKKESMPKSWGNPIRSNEERKGWLFSRLFHDLDDSIKTNDRIDRLARYLTSRIRSIRSGLVGFWPKPDQAGYRPRIAFLRFSPYRVPRLARCRIP